jgi:hypothetical protein
MHSEIGMVFGSVEYQQQYYGKMSNQKISFPNTEEQKKLTKTMMTAWASFAKDPEKGLEKMGWPMYNSQGTQLLRSNFRYRLTAITEPTVIELGSPDSSAIKFLEPKTMDQVCGQTPQKLEVTTSVL